MSIKLKELIKILKTKEQEAEVEFIVVKIDGMMVAMDVETKAVSMSNLLSLFKQHRG